MKRFALVLLGAGLLTACGGGGVRTGKDADSLDKPIGLTLGKVQTGVIAGEARDFDYYSFTAKEGDQLKLLVKTTSADKKSTLDPYIWIIMPDKVTDLERATSPEVGKDTEIRFNAPQTGTYYVKITSFAIFNNSEAADNKATNTYSLLLTNRTK